MTEVENHETRLGCACSFSCATASIPVTLGSLLEQPQSTSSFLVRDRHILEVQLLIIAVTVATHNFQPSLDSQKRQTLRSMSVAGSFAFKSHCITWRF